MYRNKVSVRGINLGLQTHLVEKGQSRGVAEAFFCNIILQIFQDSSGTFLLQGKRMLLLLKMCEGCFE
jgi:hypothetical protein